MGVRRGRHPRLPADLLNDQRAGGVRPGPVRPRPRPLRRSVRLTGQWSPRHEASSLVTLQPARKLRFEGPVPACRLVCGPAYTPTFVLALYALTCTPRLMRQTREGFSW